MPRLMAHLAFAYILLDDLGFPALLAHEVSRLHGDSGSFDARRGGVLSRARCSVSCI